MNQNADPVVSLLRHGEQNAIPAARLAEIAGFKDTRELRKYVEAKRATVPVLSSDAGYFLPSEFQPEAEQEIVRFLRRKLATADAIIGSTAAAAALLRYYNADLAQQTFWGKDG